MFGSQVTRIMFDKIDFEKKWVEPKCVFGVVLTYQKLMFGSFPTVKKKKLLIVAFRKTHVWNFSTAGPNKH